jgi:excinuclease UvrABC nuclease subunit
MTTVYRFRDADGRLLYVGIAEDPEQRILAGHVNGSRWIRHAASIELALHADRPAARAAELLAIKTENPVFNRLGRSSQAALAALVEYLGEEKALRMWRTYGMSRDCRHINFDLICRAQDRRLRLVRAMLRTASRTYVAPSA